ncbi:hypothetical protein GW17_00048515 [Ensete ventricosum]|nr:hypothetical protein GW17_00048515 [Ensete ventricosum]
MASRLLLVLPLNLSHAPIHRRGSGALPPPRPISAACTTFASFRGDPRPTRIPSLAVFPFVFLDLSLRLLPFVRFQRLGMGSG